MNRLILVALMAVGTAVGVPVSRASHAGGDGGDGHGGRGSRGGRVDVSVSRVECPSSRANVVMTAPRDHGTVEYSIYRGDTLVRNGLLWPGVQRTIPVYVEPRTTERIGVTLAGQGTTRYQVWSRCDGDASGQGGGNGGGGLGGESGASRENSENDLRGEQAYGEYRETVYRESGDDQRYQRNDLQAHRYNPLLHRQVRHLPYTGPPADLYGRLATAVGLIVFGGMLWWVGLIWPRRTPGGPLLRPRVAQAGRRRAA